MPIGSDTPPTKLISAIEKSRRDAPHDASLLDLQLIFVYIKAGLFL
jgi:hypothetical protein